MGSGPDQKQLRPGVCKRPFSEGIQNKRPETKGFLRVQGLEHREAGGLGSLFFLLLLHRNNRTQITPLSDFRGMESNSQLFCFAVEKHGFSLPAVNSPLDLDVCPFFSRVRGAGRGRAV